MKLVLGVTGATGALYAKIFIDYIQNREDIELSVVSTMNGLRIFSDEVDADLREYGVNYYDDNDFDVPFVSGSAPYHGMVVMPCSMGMLGRIAHGVSHDVISRTADVMLKEKRPLILVPRETPLSSIHLKNMLTLSDAGAIILPAMPSFYSEPKTMEDLATTVVSRVLDQLNIHHDLTDRWCLEK
ncbi:UbiX family flavin prenyltransferase [bacterium]|nr:UbiX family flavin prenyltransferase [bacterium]MBU1918430.1 UbiX family flavin prenyltransferase [bacterium]